MIGAARWGASPPDPPGYLQREELGVRWRLRTPAHLADDIGIFWDIMDAQKAETQCEICRALLQDQGRAIGPQI